MLIWQVRKLAKIEKKGKWVRLEEQEQEGQNSKHVKGETL